MSDKTNPTASPDTQQSPSSSDVRRLFVYGTLRRQSAHRMARYLAENARFVGEGTTQGTLVNLGFYPGLAASGDTAVVGDVYEFPEDSAGKHIAALDAYEGCGANDPPPHEYRRELIPVRIADGPEEIVWGYLMNDRPERFEIIPGGDYLAWVLARVTG